MRSITRITWMSGRPLIGMSGSLRRPDGGTSRGQHEGLPEPRNDLRRGIGLRDPRAHERGVVVNLDRLQDQGLCLGVLSCSDLPQ
jgi:hypothetical protein